MLKKSVAVIVLCTVLGGCISEPRDPAFAGAAGINPEVAAKNRVSLGLTYLSNGNFSQAKANLDRALAFAPKSANAHFAMAYYYQQVDELVLADEYYATALKISPENPDIINSYGAFLCEQGKYEKAKSYFLKAVTSKSYVSTAETYENLAICAIDQGKTEEAISFFESALNHQPTRGKSLFSLAQLQKQQGNFGEAKKTLWKFDRVSRVSPESLWLSYEIARALGDTKGALEYGELMITMFPENPNNAVFKQQMGKYQPVATVTNKRRTASPDANVSLQDKSDMQGLSTEQPDVENNSAQSAQLKVNKKSKTLIPPVSLPLVASSPTDSVRDLVVGSSSEKIQQGTDANAENKETTPSAIVDGDADDAKLSSEDAAKREAELEAALAADFMSENKRSVATGSEAVVTIDGTVEKVNSELAKADEIAEKTKEEGVDIADKLAMKAGDALNTNDVADNVEDDGSEYHIVAVNENLYRISLKYNVQMKYLMQWNNLDDPAITIGMKLRVKDPKNND